VKKKAKKRKTFVVDEEKAAMLVNVSCVTRSSHKK
jgi:hypothetical protein